MIDLPAGNELDEAATYAITRAAPSRLVLLAGPVESGKTTLLSSIYERFLEGPFAGFLFAGSRTLPAFERRCHLGRIASGAVSASTERTPLGAGESLLHLRVCPQHRSGLATDILFTDMSGEAFRMVAVSSLECRRMTIIRRVHRFVLLVDAGKLCDVAQRQSASKAAITLLRSCLDEGMLGKRSLIDILITKWDLVEDAPEEQRTEAIEYAAAFEARVQHRFDGDFGRLRVFRVAARPREGSSLPPAFTLDKVFPSWVLDGPNALAPFLWGTVEAVSGREFDKFGAGSGT